ncbi:MAG: hypothetical protein EOM15_10980, partial [Spirochaetia bacterium]|nr:hypothetical protein [Spirochaetia bacterium]
MKVMREEQFQQVLGTMLMIQSLFLLISFFLLRASTSWVFIAFGRFAYLFPLLLVLHGLSFAFSNSLRQYRQLLLLMVQLLSISALGGAFALLRSSDTAHYAGVLGSIPSILIGKENLKLLIIILSLVPASLTLGLPYLKHVQSLILPLQGSFHSLLAASSQRLKKVTMRPKSLEAGTIDSCLVHNEALPLSILPKHEANPLFSASRNSLSEACLQEMEMLIINIAVARAKVQIHRVTEKPPIIAMHVILFSFAPDEQSTVSVNRLSLLANDLGIALKRAPVHVQLTQYISIEVPLSEDERRFVSIGSLLQRCLETPEKGPCYLLGTSAKGDAYQLPVRGCYHMLVGGQTNSGKSVMLHTIIFGFIFRYPPSKVGLVLYDHKVE